MSMIKRPILRPRKIVVPPIKKPLPIMKKPLPMVRSTQVLTKQMNGLAGNYTNGDFGSPMGLNLMDVLKGKTDITSAITSLAYDEAMKQVSKYGNIVTSFANKAKSEANAVIAIATKIQTASSPEEVSALIAEAKKRASAASNEASNAVKNYSLTAGALNTLLKVPGLPSSVKDAANGILAAAKKSVDAANAASATAKQAADQIEQYGGSSSFLPSFSSFESPFMRDYGAYLLIGGGVLALGLIGFIIYKRTSK